MKKSIKESANHSTKKAIKQSTATKLFSVASIIAILLAIVMVSFATISKNELIESTEKKIALTENANNLRNASRALTSDIRAYAATGVIDFYNSYLNEVNNLKTRELAVEAMTQIGLTEGELASIQEVFATSTALANIETEAAKLVQIGALSSARGLLHDDTYRAGSAKVTTLIDELFVELNTRTNANITRIGMWVSIFNLTTYISLALVLIIQLMIIVFISSKLLKPVLAIKENMLLLEQGDLSTELAIPVDESEIGETAAAVKSAKANLKLIIDDLGQLLGAMAGGDFTVRSENFEQYKGEYAQIMDSMRTLGKGQNKTLSQISEAAEQVAAGSDQLAAGAQALSQGATEQASSVEKLSESVSGITTRIAANAANAKSANQISMVTSSEVEEGNKKMDEMVTAMQAITEKSSEIGKIIKTIDDIAFQTNILALNAAVEAARAGSAGKGFAVVADEVRNLAQKSAEAAKNTTQLIEDSILAVGNGTRIAGETAKSLGTIVGRVTEIRKVIAEIAEASEHQADATSQISIGIDQISVVTQTNSATAEQSAAASEELSSQSQMLKDLISQYKLTNN